MLLLDEPTNDLDLETMGILESFIDDFNGAIIFVSHDRFFIDRMAQKVFVYTGKAGEIECHVGGYSDYHQRLQAEQKARAGALTNGVNVKAKDGVAVSKKNYQQDKVRKKGLTMSEKHEYGEIEAVIASKEGELKMIHLQMTQFATDYDKIQELTKEETRVSGELEKLMERWAYLEEKAENS